MKGFPGKRLIQKSDFHSRLLITILVVGLITVSACLAGCASNNDQKDEQPVETVAAPDVEGMTADDALRVIEADGFTAGTNIEEFSETVPAGNVISQDPKPGTEVEAGTYINLVISKGSDQPPAQVGVPNLFGLTQAQAEQVLFDLKLIPVAGDPVFSTEVEPGRVFKQAIAPGTSVEVGSRIGFTAALGSEIVTVPNVIGQSRDAAVNAMTAAGLGVDVHQEYNSSVAAGNVFSQNPNPRVQCVAGTTVVLFISSGPAPAGLIVVPDLSTYTLPMAIQSLNSAGLLLSPTGSDLNGTVVSQNPAPGTRVQQGTTITAEFQPVFL